jgi:citrate lyase synthetase
MTMNIRKFKEEDAVQLSNIICKCADSSLDMNQENVNYIKSKNTPKKIIEASKEFTLLLAFVDEKLVGGGGIDKNRIRKMFIDPEYQRKGIGRKIYESLETIAIKNKQEKIYLHAAPNAVRFYAKFGFKEIGKDDFGAIIMEKKLK